MGYYEVVSVLSNIEEKRRRRGRGGGREKERNRTQPTSQIPKTLTNTLLGNLVANI
jgi:hypothetical protein